MSTSVNGNDGFSKIKDSVYDSKLIDGLVEFGILPAGYQIITGSVDLEGAVAGAYAVVDADGNTLHIAEGKQILAAYYVNSGATMTATSQVALGLALTDGGAEVDGVIAAADAEVGQTAAPLLVGVNNYPVVTVSVATNVAASVLQVTFVLTGLAAN